MWYVYDLRDTKSENLYVGMTNDLARRFSEHLSGKTKTTAWFKEPRLIYYEACEERRDAAMREKQLKTGFGRAYISRRLKHAFAPIA